MSFDPQSHGAVRDRSWFFIGDLRVWSKQGRDKSKNGGRSQSGRKAPTVGPGATSGWIRPAGQTSDVI